MIVPVHMLAFSDDKSRIRYVDIPEKDLTLLDDPTSAVYYPSLLQVVWRYGQNDFQSQPMPSVSAGDVAEINGRYFMFTAFKASKYGYDEYTKAEFDALVPPTTDLAYGFKRRD